MEATAMRGALQSRAQGGEFLYGVNPLREVLRSGRRRLLELFIAEGRGRGRELEGLLRAAEEAGVPVKWMARAELGRLCGSKEHQGVVGRVSAFSFKSLEDLIEAALKGAEPLILVLDGVQDPRNLGALLRSAAALGAAGAVFPRERAAPLSPVAVKASAGASEHMPLARVVNVARALCTMRERGFWCLGIDLGDYPPIWESCLRSPIALVVGSEGRGIRPLVRRSCDALATIPMAPHGVESLNVAVAGAVGLYEVLRKRECGNKKLA